MTALWWGGYLLAFVVTYRHVYEPMLNVLSARPEPDSEERVVSAVLAMVVALLWPLTLVMVVIYLTLTPATRQQRETRRANEARDRAARQAHMDPEG